MKKIVYSCIAILLLVGLIVYGFISAPKVIRVDEQFEVSAYKLEDSSFSQPVSITLAGVFDEKSESYLGKLTVNGKEYTSCRLEPRFLLMFCNVDDNGPRDMIGTVYADKDFKEWSLKVDSSYNSGKTENDLYTLLNQGASTQGSIILNIPPATDRDSSLKLFDRLWRNWSEGVRREYE